MPTPSVRLKSSVASASDTEVIMGDKNPKSKKRNENQKSASQKNVNAKAKAKQAGQSKRDDKKK